MPRPLRPITGVRVRRPFVGSGPPAAAAVTRRVSGIVYGAVQGIPAPQAGRAIVLRRPRTAPAISKPLPRVIVARQSLPTPVVSRANILRLPPRPVVQTTKLVPRILLGRVPFTISVIGRAIISRVYQPPRNYKTPKPRVLHWRGLLPSRETSRSVRIVVPPRTVVQAAPPIICICVDFDHVRSATISFDHTRSSSVDFDYVRTNTVNFDVCCDCPVPVSPPPPLAVTYTIAESSITQTFTPPVSGDYFVEMQARGGMGSGDGTGGGGGGYASGTVTLVGGVGILVTNDPGSGFMDYDLTGDFINASAGADGVGGGFGGGSASGSVDGIAWSGSDAVVLTGGAGGGAHLGKAGGHGQDSDGTNTGIRAGYFTITGPLS